MLYCSMCADRNGWPKNENKTHGVTRCEFCKRPAVLNFTPDASLRAPRPLDAIEAEGARKRSEP